MKLLIWNILHPDFEDEKNEDTSRVLKIFDQIKSYQPDIACLQEVDSAQIDGYSEVFSDYQIIWQDSRERVNKLQKWREKGGKKPHTMVCATLVRKGIEVIKHTMGSRSLSVTIKYGDRELTITNVHLESGRDVNEIHLKHLKKLIHSDVLCGDFNDFIGEPAIEYVKDNGYLSVYAKSRPEFTFHDLGRKMLIDFIFYKGKLKLSDVEWENETNYSDHVPVIANISLKE